MPNVAKMDNPSKISQDRRKFLGSALAGAAGLMLVNGPATWAAKKEAKKPGKQEEEPGEEVAPAEDLMREHGVLNRILLIYDESITRLGKANPDLPLDVVADSAGIIRHFIEDYHEKLEEDFLFPRLRKAGKEVELVEVLLAQHRAGRTLTDQIIASAKQTAMKDESAKLQLQSHLRAFNRMYRPHEAREDTILFPAFKSIVSPHEYAALGEDFEDKEHQLFGEDGFEKMVDRVAGLERKLGIYDLAQFTPKP
ncbi:MAG: hemerythrin domain-containing protein [Candidatus Sumerlaeaceae bacterium]|nr:hemerythrin domain-containing protein [Candidatus Sumerlaeaceae bacterium]